MAVKKRVVKKKSVARKVAAPKPKRKRISAKTAKVLTALSRGEMFLTEINRLEAKRKKAVGQQAKDLYQVEINALHKKVDKLIKQRKSA